MSLPRRTHWAIRRHQQLQRRKFIFQIKVNGTEIYFANDLVCCVLSKQLRLQPSLTDACKCVQWLHQIVDSLDFLSRAHTWFWVAPAALRDSGACLFAAASLCLHFQCFTVGSLHCTTLFQLPTSIVGFARIVLSCLENWSNCRISKDPLNPGQKLKIIKGFIQYWNHKWQGNAFSFYQDECGAVTALKASFSSDFHCHQPVYFLSN